MTIPEWQFSCHSCGQCCRDWHVRLSPEEVRRLDALEYPPEANVPARRTVIIRGQTYVAHRDDGACVYLDPDGNRCRIHAAHGYERKPLTCRVYPFSIQPTFGTERSCICRFDCPSVRAKQGQPLKRSRAEIERLANDLETSGPFDAATLSSLAPEVVKKIVRGLAGMLEAHADPLSRPLAALTAVQRLAILGEPFLNASPLEKILPPVFERSSADSVLPARGQLSRTHQLRFLSLLAMFLRRDEQTVHGTGLQKLGRLAATMLASMGRSNLRALGDEHPDAPLDRARFFGPPGPEPAASPVALIWDLIAIRLESFQFMGAGLHGLPIYAGLRAIFVGAELMMALARWTAITRSDGPDPGVITEADVSYAVGAIDHGFGRGALFHSGPVVGLIEDFATPDVSARLLAELFVD